MGEIARSLQNEVNSVIEALKEERTREGQSEKSRLLAIAITHLETAKLFIKETESM